MKPNVMMLGAMKIVAALLLLSPVLSAAVCATSNLDEKAKLVKFQELDRAAQSALDSGQFTLAAQQYQEAVCLAPQSARALYGLGVAEAAAGRFAAARKARRSKRLTRSFRTTSCRLRCWRGWRSRRRTSIV
jgi:Flp pilus assembly protein TadD